MRGVARRARAARRDDLRDIFSGKIGLSVRASEGTSVHRSSSRT